MYLEALKEELIEGLLSLDNALAPYRMVSHAVTELGGPELVSAYQSYMSLHDIYEEVIQRIRAAGTAEEVLEAYRALSQQPVVTEQDEEVIGI